MISLWVTALLLSVLYVLYRRAISRYLVLDTMFPGPFALPILGNAIEVLGSTFYRRSYEYFKYYKTNFRMWFGHLAYVAIVHPDEAEAIMSSTVQIDKSDEYHLLAPWIGYGLLTLTGEKWRTHRKILTPAFHFKILESFVDIFNANGDILCEKLSKHVDKVPLDIYEYVKLYALDNICETAMGTSVNAQTTFNSAYVQAVKDVCIAVFQRSVSLPLRANFIFNLSKYGKMQRNALEIIHGTTKRVIRQRKQAFADKKKAPSMPKEESDLNMKQKHCFLDILLLAQDEYGLTDEDIRAEVDTFLFEGHDTITSGISFSLYSLAENPDIQGKVLQEQVSMFGNDLRSPSYRELQDMKYLEQVIKESLRLYPSVPFIGRTIGEDLPLKHGKFLPKGTQIIMVMSALQRNPDIWTNPDKFNPENFAPDNLVGKHPYASVPFSAGPRNCIGQKFAMLEMKSAISKIIRKFELLECPNPDDKPLITADIIINSENGIKVRLSERQPTHTSKLSTQY